MPRETFTGTNYNIPGDNTDPDGLYNLWTSTETEYVNARNQILNNHQVIAFKSCFPASDIPDAATLAQYQAWYLGMRDFFDTRTDRLFIVMSTPPLHHMATDADRASNARAFADWLCSDAYLSGHSNVRCFNLFDYLARQNDGSATANMLRYEYEGSHSDSDSHPNTVAQSDSGRLSWLNSCAMLRRGIEEAARNYGLSDKREWLVGARGFEPPTPRSRTVCATRLRYAPTGNNKNRIS